MYNVYKHYPYAYYADTPMNDLYVPVEEAGYGARVVPPPPKNTGVLRDYGPKPFVTDLDRLTKLNQNYRTALWTGNHLQLTLMSIKVGDDIGLEVHPAVDQFIRIEQGQGVAQMGPARNQLTYQRKVFDGYAVFVPAGTWHNVVNTGRTPLKVYSIYAPPQHPRGTIEATKEIANAGTGD